MPRRKSLPPAVLAKAQAELGRDCQQVIKNISLGAFISHPTGGCGKTIQLNRHAHGFGFQRTHYECHGLVDARVGA